MATKSFTDNSSPNLRINTTLLNGIGIMKTLYMKVTVMSGNNSMLVSIDNGMLRRTTGRLEVGKDNAITKVEFTTKALTESQVATTKIPLLNPSCFENGDNSNGCEPVLDGIFLSRPGIRFESPLFANKTTLELGPKQQHQGFMVSSIENSMESDTVPDISVCVWAKIESNSHANTLFGLVGVPNIGRAGCKMNNNNVMECGTRLVVGRSANKTTSLLNSQGIVWCDIANPLNDRIYQSDGSYSSNYPDVKFDVAISATDVIVTRIDKPSININLQSNKACSSSNKCNVCMGDCNYDYDCIGNLKCFERQYYDSSQEGATGDDVPGCDGGNSDLSSTDYCYGDVSKGWEQDLVLFCMTEMDRPSTLTVGTSSLNTGYSFPERGLAAKTDSRCPDFYDERPSLGYTSVCTPKPIVQKTVDGTRGSEFQVANLEDCRNKVRQKVSIANGLEFKPQIPDFSKESETGSKWINMEDFEVALPASLSSSSTRDCSSSYSGSCAAVLSNGQVSWEPTRTLSMQTRYFCYASQVTSVHAGESQVRVTMDGFPWTRATTIYSNKWQWVCLDFKDYALKKITLTCKVC